MRRFGEISRHPHEQGFTLIQILIAVVIATLIAAISAYFFSLSSTQGHALYEQTMRFVHASQFFAHDTGCYPGTLSVLGTAGANGQATGLNQCAPEQNDWDGPYLSAVTFNGQSVRIPALQSGKTGTTAQIETGQWLDGNSAMQGRGQEEIAIVTSPVTPSAQASFCKACNGCSGNGQSTASTCFTTSGDTIGYVFATAQ